MVSAQTYTCKSTLRRAWSGSLMSIQTLRKQRGAVIHAASLGFSRFTIACHIHDRREKDYHMRFKFSGPGAGPMHNLLQN